MTRFTARFPALQRWPRRAPRSRRRFSQSLTGDALPMRLFAGLEAGEMLMGAAGQHVTASTASHAPLSPLSIALR